MHPAVLRKRHVRRFAWCLAVAVACANCGSEGTDPDGTDFTADEGDASDSTGSDGETTDDAGPGDVPGDCIPQCSGRVCGDDSCGGTCEPGCGTGEVCTPSGTCAAGSAHVLFNSNRSTTTRLLDMDTKTVVHSWNRTTRPGNCVYLLENGNLLRPGETMGIMRGGGAGGLIEEIDWDNNVVWQFEYSTATVLQHHDVARMPNGNTLMIAWEVKTAAEALQAGRATAVEMWPDHIIEVEPTGSSGGNIVWEWHAWDHLVQDRDPTKDNYGVVADHPERIDVNLGEIRTGGPGGSGDWLHLNSVDYNPELDQVIVSSHTLSEVWIIDHSTTTAEAAGHSGGDSGRGGDLLFRWGNPQNYGAGTSTDRSLFVVHCAHWIPAGLPGAGDILLFNNGDGRPGGNYSSVEELVPPIDGSGYEMAGGVWGPSAPAWTYTAPTPSTFFSNHISSAQRMASGNTFICEGTSGTLFEVTSAGETVWEYSVGEETARAYRYDADYPGLARLRE